LGNWCTKCANNCTLSCFCTFKNFQVFSFFKCWGHSIGGYLQFWPFFAFHDKGLFPWQTPRWNSPLFSHKCVSPVACIPQKVEGFSAWSTPDSLAAISDCFPPFQNKSEVSRRFWRSPFGFRRQELDIVQRSDWKRPVGQASTTGCAAREVFAVDPAWSPLKNA